MLCYADAGAWMSLPHGQRSAEGASGVGGVLLAVPGDIPQVRRRVQNTQLPDEVGTVEILLIMQAYVPYLP